MPSEGRSRESILAELAGFAHSEDKAWETGKCSGTMYCGDHEHYEFMGRAFELFAHVNALQRDICPSMTKFEGEIIAMALDLLHADAVGDGGNPVGLVTSGGSGSILHAVLVVPRARAADPRHRPAQLREARDRSPRVRQGVPPARRRAATRADRPQDHAGRRRRGGRADRRQHDRDHGLGLQLRLRHHRPDRRAVRPRARARRRPPRRRLPRRLHPAVGPGARLRHPAVRLPRARASRRSRPTPTSTATASRARRCSRSATSRCATASTSS